MPGLNERAMSFRSEEGARHQERNADRKGRRVSREHAPKSTKIAEELHAIREAEQPLLQNLEERIDRYEFTRNARPIIESFLRGVVPDFFHSGKKTDTKEKTLASKKEHPRYSPTLLAQRGEKHDLLRLRQGELILTREKLFGMLLNLTRETRERLEEASSKEEEEKIRDEHRHKRVELLREIREAQTELLKTTKALGAFLKTVESQKEKPSIVQDAFQRARDFLMGESKQKAPKSTAARIQDKELESSTKAHSRLEAAAQALLGRLTGTTEPKASRKQLYSVIRQSIENLKAAESEAASRILSKQQPESKIPPEESQDPGTREDSELKQPQTGGVVQEQSSAAERAAVFMPLASRILEREELKRMSPDGLRQHIMNRLLAIAGKSVSPQDQLGLMPQSAYEESLAKFLQDPGTTEEYFEQFNRFLAQESSKLDSDPQSTTFSKGYLSVFTKAIQMIAGEREMRKAAGGIRGNFLLRAGIIEKMEALDEPTFDNLLSEYVHSSECSSEKLDALLLSAQSGAKNFSMLEERFANIFASGIKIIQEAMDKPRAPETNESIVDTELGNLLFQLGVEGSRVPISPADAQAHVDAWLAGVPGWNDDTLRVSFAAVSALIVKEGMAGIKTQTESPFLPFLRAVSARLKEERSSRTSLQVALREGIQPALEESGEAPYVGGVSKDEVEVSKEEGPLLDYILGQQPNVLRGTLLGSFSIPGADIAVGEKYFINRLAEWLALPQTTHKQKQDLLDFCQLGKSKLETAQMVKKREKQRVFDQAIEQLEGAL